MTVANMFSILIQIGLPGVLGAGITNALGGALAWRWAGFKPAAATSVATNVIPPGRASQTDHLQHHL